MKFAEHLQAHITPEWRKQYIQYEDMKSLLYNAVEQSPSAEIEDTDVTTRYFAKFDEKFFHFCDKELTKINTFFSEKLAEATRRFATLKSELTASKDASLETSDVRRRKAIQNKLRGRTSARKLQDMKLAFSEFYLSLILLQNYQNLNFTGFRKILKKHDKLLATEEGASWRIEHVEVAAFATNKDIDKLIAETEAVFTNELEGGDRQKAMKRLRVPPLGEQQNPLTTFKVGLFSGAFIVLLTAVIISAIAHQGLDDWRIVFRLYRGLFLIILFIFLLGINIYGWRSSGVNHVLIFELDPRNHLSEQHLMEMAAVFGVLWCLSVLAFLYSAPLGIPPYINPLILVIVMLVFLLNPTRTFRHEARFWFLRILGRIVCAPLFFVGFADFWIADQLNSLVPALLDFEYLICFYATSSGWTVAQDTSKCVDKTWVVRPIIACLPAWFRFAQCLRRYRDLREANPHLLNAGKYATTFTVVVFSTLNIKYKDNYLEDMNPFFYVWIVALVVSSCYAYMWDIRMDWGLFDPDAGENTFLREEIVYSSPGYYYFGIVEDFVLRFGWTLSISLTEMGYIHGDLMLTVLAPLEVFRRFVWNFFRLENEHLNNCGKFRAVRDISVAPIHDSDQAIMIRMMDDDDGVMNRKKKKGGKKKTDAQKLLGEESTEHDPYATVTSISSVKNWFANITSKMGNVD